MNYLPRLLSLLSNDRIVEICIHIVIKYIYRDFLFLISL